MAESVKRMAVYGVLAIAVGVGIAGILHVANIAPFGQRIRSADDDRPPIIVRDGSIIFEGGDSQNPKKGKDGWARVSGSSQHWKTDQIIGHNVAGFTVYIAGFVDPVNCAQTTLPADAVEIDYSTGSATLAFHVRHMDDGSGHKHEPRVDADDPSGLAPPATTSSTYPQLVADAGGTGYISKVVASDANGVATSCAFPAPDATTRALVRVTVVPERK